MGQGEWVQVRLSDTRPRQPRDNVFIRTIGPLFVRGAGTLEAGGGLHYAHAFLGAPRGASVCRDNSRPLLPACDFRSALAVVDITPYGSRRTCGDGARCKAGREGQGGCTERHHRGERHQVIQPRPRLAVKPQKDPPGGDDGAPVGWGSSPGPTGGHGRTMPGSESHEEK